MHIPTNNSLMLKNLSMSISLRHKNKEYQKPVLYNQSWHKLETQFVKQKYWFRLILGQKHQCQQ